MNEKGTMRLIGTAIAGALCGGVFVFLVMRPSGDASLPAPSDSSLSGPSGKSTGPAVGTTDAPRAARITAGDAKTPTQDTLKKPIADTRVILSEDPEGVRQTLVPGPAESIPWDPNEPNEYASLPKQEIRDKIRDQQRVMNELSAGRVECLRKIQELKQQNDREDPEIMALQKEFNEKRKLLETRMRELPGVAAHEDKYKALMSDTDLLAKRRQAITEELKGLTAKDLRRGEAAKPVAGSEEKFSTLSKELVEINKKIQELQDDMLKEFLASTSLKKDARDNNAEIKQLTAELIEKQHLLEAKKSQAPNVLEWRKKLQEYDKQYEQAARLNVKLHRALQAPVPPETVTASGS